MSEEKIDVDGTTANDIINQMVKMLGRLQAEIFKLSESMTDGFVEVNNRLTFLEGDVDNVRDSLSSTKNNEKTSSTPINSDNKRRSFLGSMVKDPRSLVSPSVNRYGASETYIRTEPDQSHIKLTKLTVEAVESFWRVIDLYEKRYRGVTVEVARAIDYDIVRLLIPYCPKQDNMTELEFYEQSSN